MSEKSVSNLCKSKPIFKDTRISMLKNDLSSFLIDFQGDSKDFPDFLREKIEKKNTKPLNYRERLRDVTKNSSA